MSQYVDEKRSTPSRSHTRPTNRLKSISPVFQSLSEIMENNGNTVDTRISLLSKFQASKASRGQRISSFKHLPTVGFKYLYVLCRYKFFEPLASMSCTTSGMATTMK
ncbi:hypothetical protein K443DRAFT_171727 [Laccaria amethystina LaAM-08-1]|uniref:Unplaced genomic scaffold K443scaffold_111, whole genome shotgun sequence n=1 Tax=Laccaria amethystina LaAM-08-1 TaxID=1095629 RepID=A0A0C9X373_9AGAR|nr:hypothetical protein K443DRAFT_171727 [Laccaria amethystina LaAM-08-1]